MTISVEVERFPNNEPAYKRTPVAPGLASEGMDIRKVAVSWPFAERFSI